MGGSVKAIESGFMQSEIADASYRYQKDIENGSKTIVGVNKFTVDAEEQAPSFKIDDNIRIAQIQKLNQLKQDRNSVLVQEKLQNLQAAATEGRNVMPFIIEAVDAYATLGEVADLFRNIYGEYRA
jgi:methylmalonyl-CoA mutase N-terminal domain/subunit